MDTAAKLIALAPGNIHFLSYADTNIGAVSTLTGSSHIASGYDLIIFYDNSPIMAAQTGAALRYDLGQVKIVVFFVSSFHEKKLYPLSRKKASAGSNLHRGERSENPFCNSFKILYN